MDSRDRLPRTLVEAVQYFAKPDNCLTYMVGKRWPNGVTCPVCGSQKVHFDRTRMGWRCTTKHANRRFTLKTGTIFVDSPLGLDKWLPVVWMIANCKNGVSSWEIHRSIGVTQKTAWFMLHRVRLAMQDIDGGGKLGGIGSDVEVDETFIGGKARNMHHRRRADITKGRKNRRWGHMLGKVAVQGLLERHNRKGHSVIKVEIVPDNRKRALDMNVRKYVQWGTDVHTDELGSYNELGDDYIHNVINHAEKYVDGNVHTNGCENFWSLLKRGLKGTYVSVEPFHLFRYLDEQACRFNTRMLSDADRFGFVMEQIVGRRLTYAELIGPDEDERAI
jgi:transposase-like protein